MCEGLGRLGLRVLGVYGVRFGLLRASAKP